MINDETEVKMSENLQFTIIIPFLNDNNINHLRKNTKT